MSLRGYDSYDVLLGDEMRGERASQGLSLKDAERALKIRAHLLEAIEMCDAERFANKSTVAGYVRSYARFLGMDPDGAYARFCHESGFRSPAAAQIHVTEGGSGATGKVAALNNRAGAELTSSRFAVKPAPKRIGPRVSLGALFSVTAFFALAAGVGYGGFTVLENIQKVGIAPVEETPRLVAAVPELARPSSADAVTALRPDVSVYENQGALAAGLSFEGPAPVGIARRDGPISAIDPETAGVVVEQASLRRTETAEPVAEAFGPEPLRTAEGPAPAPERALPETPDPALEEAARQPDVATAIVAAGEAWIRVRDPDHGVLFEGILQKGERYEMPKRAAQPTLRAGNAGSVFVAVGGATFGPVGRPGGVVKNVSLRRADLEGALPLAEAAVPPPRDGGRALTQASLSE